MGSIVSAIGRCVAWNIEGHWARWADRWPGWAHENLASVTLVCLQMIYCKLMARSRIAALLMIGSWHIDWFLAVMIFARVAKLLQAQRAGSGPTASGLFGRHTEEPPRAGSPVESRGSPPPPPSSNSIDGILRLWLECRLWCAAQAASGDSHFSASCLILGERIAGRQMEIFTAQDSPAKFDRRKFLMEIDCALQIRQTLRFVFIIFRWLSPCLGPFDWTPLLDKAQGGNQNPNLWPSLRPNEKVKQTEAGDRAGEGGDRRGTKEGLLVFVY